MKRLRFKRDVARRRKGFGVFHGDLYIGYVWKSPLTRVWRAKYADGGYSAAAFKSRKEAASHLALPILVKDR